MPLVERPSCEQDVSSIVLLGSLNPAIFHPSWFAMNKLVRLEEAETAKVKVVASEVSEFELGGWLTIQVTQERFLALSSDSAHAEPLRDLALGTFGLLEHTPIKRMGLNRHMHYLMPSEEKWHAFGHLLAPKGVWSSVLETPGLANLTILGKRPKHPSTSLRVSVQPSARFKPGVFIEVNEDHSPEGATTAGLMAILRDNWLDAQMYSKDIAEHLITQEY